MSTFTASLKAPWRQMVVVNAALMLCLFLYKVLPFTAVPEYPYITFGTEIPYLPYLHLIVDYHFGFMKRALIGAIVSFALPVVPVWFVFAFAGVLWLIALVLFLVLFKRTFGFDTATIPLFTFMFGSPFFFKNFIQNLGYFDIFGCIAALIMLLLPARSFLYVVFGAFIGVVLILIHPIHMLMYVPLIGMVVVMRFFLVRNAVALEIAAGLGLALVVAGAFVGAAFYGLVPVPREQFVEHLRSRTADDAVLTSPMIKIWYMTISEDIALTWESMPRNALRFPFYAALVALHWPVIRYGWRLIDALADAWHRRLALLGAAGITVGYFIIGAVAYDYPRWVSNWAVCLFLLLHAIKLLPARASAPPIADDKLTRMLGWAVTVLPRVGTQKPF